MRMANFTYKPFHAEAEAKEWREISESEKKEEEIVRRVSKVLVVILSVGIVISIFALSTTTFTRTWYDQFGNAHAYQLTNAIFLPAPVGFGGMGLFIFICGSFHNCEMPRVPLKNRVQEEILAGKLTTLPLEEIYKSSIRLNSLSPAVNAGILTIQQAQQLRDLLKDKEAILRTKEADRPYIQPSIQRVQEQWSSLQSEIRKQILKNEQDILS